MTSAATHMLKDLSIAQRIALAPTEAQKTFYADHPPETLMHEPSYWLRPSQLLPMDRGDSWSLGAMVAGRGAGKTRVMSEWARFKARTMPGSRGAFVARTAADARDVLVHGESGIINISPVGERPLYEPSKRLLTWPNGTTALLFTSEAPDQLRGPQFHWAIADEVASWIFMPDESGLTAYDNLQLATRLGTTPQILVATTPRRTPFMKQLMAKETDPRTLLIRGTTYDNAANLAQVYLDTITGLYGGTRLAKQELEGVLLEDVEGALFHQDLIDTTRLVSIPPHQLRVVAVDPSVADRPTDECGIVVAAATAEKELFKRHVYVLEDASVWGAPSVWAQRVVETAQRWAVSTIIAEGNQGAALVADAIRSLDPALRVVMVHARVNKATRAEPVAIAWDRQHVRMVGVHPMLESQMTSWDPSDDRAKSPDRLDAMVWAVTALAIKPPAELVGGTLRAGKISAARRRLPMPVTMPLGGRGTYADRIASRIMAGQSADPRATRPGSLH